MKKLAIYSFVDPKKISSYSGTPYYLIKYIESFNLEVITVTGQVEKLSYRLLRIMYSAFKLVLLKPPGGFQYTSLALRLSYALSAVRYTDCALISLYQLVPKRFQKNDISLYFFIDQTLVQLFETYPEFKKLDVYSKKEAIKKEIVGYRKAKAIFANSDYASESLIRDYGVDSKKILVVPQGANYDLFYINEILEKRRKNIAYKNEFTFTFIGYDYKRKGLVRVINILNILIAREYKVNLIVIGPPKWPEEIKKYEWIEYFGKLDKVTCISIFSECLIRTDVGIMLSSAEAGGIVVREFQVFGIPIVVSNVGGISDQIDSHKSALLVNIGQEDVYLADQLCAWLGDNDKFGNMLNYAFSDATKSSWIHSVEKILSAINAKQ
ncbi:glycosyltransferase family 4 protein [Coleofasciculus sp. LEGE 07081]|nr:glycosyltransferase family 4 protein [Coleofasciculus sp. LEGE 07081]